jgi:outer membrane protein
MYQLALRNDPTFEVARYTLKAAQQKYPQAIAGLLPTVNANGVNNFTNAQYQFSNASSIDRNVHAWNWSLQLTQPLIRLQNLYAYDEAKVILEQAQAQYNLAEQDMILRITGAYFGLLASREGIKVAEAELSATEEQRELAKRGFEKGLVAMTDVREAQSRADLARSHLVAAQNELDAKDAELGKIVDEVPEQLAALDPAVNIPAPQPNQQKLWVAQAHDNNSAVLAAQFGLLAAEALVGKTRAEHTPTLDLVAAYGEDYSSGSTRLQTDFASRGRSRQIGVQFSVPLFAGGATSSHVGEAVANKYRAGAELEVAHRQATTDARLAYAGVVNGLSQITALTSTVESSQSAVEGNHAGYKLGIYSNINVLNAVQQLYTAKRDLVKARYDTLFQALKLKAAAGSLSEADLLNTNALLLH